MKVPELTSLFSFFSLTALCSLQAVPVHGQTYGCKDPTAANYNPSATVNDGSCIYNTVFYTPPVKVDPMPSVLVETSGLQMAGGYLWSFNDGGNAASMYRIDTLTNALLQTVNLEGTTNVDWEDMAFDGTHFYIGDFGNNANGARTDLKIYKFPLSAIPDYATDPVATVPAAQIEIINFRYSDQVPVVATGFNQTRFDCEAMLVDGGKLHLFSKNWLEPVTTHYVIDGIAAGTYVATPVETLVTNYLVTAADKVPGLNMIALIGYQNSGFGDHFIHLLSAFTEGRYFNGNKRLVDLPDAAEMGQVEGLTFRNANYGYISNEKFVRTVFGFTITVNQKLRVFNTSDFAPSYVVLPTELDQFSVTAANQQNRISWQFTDPVQQLQVQHSIDRTTFATIHTAGTALRERFMHQPSASSNCYRLSWKTATGTVKYSKIECISNALKTSLSNLVLRSNGELALVKAAGGSDAYSFRLLSTDGRLLAQTTKRVISQGLNKINFSRGLPYNHVLLLQAVSKSESSSQLLRVEY